jgi:predicted membrane metal-binding protein
MNQSGLSLMDKLRIEPAVHRVDFVLDARVPRGKRRQIRNELRSNLTEAAQEVGVAAAIRQLGDLRVLANSYLELYRGRFDFVQAFGGQSSCMPRFRF